MVSADPVGDAHLHKKQKRERKQKKIKEPRPDQCEYFVEKKNRRCSLQRRKNHRFCSEHVIFEENTVEGSGTAMKKRIPCPLDPNHNVDESDLQAHLKRCNSRGPKAIEPWYRKDFNARLNETYLEAEKEEGSSVESEVYTDSTDSAGERSAFRRIAGLLETYGSTLDHALPENLQSHPGLDSMLESRENKKHIRQQSSLVGAMKERGLLSSDKFYMEFGCGKAELSRMVNACVVYDTLKEAPKPDAASPNYGYGLIDRGVNRMKSDSKIASDCESSGLSPQIKRSRIDIQHLDLDRFLESVPHGPLVAISKHLCGVATDLTLKSILNSPKSRDRLDGVVVAMCCRHACDYGQLLPPSREYLAAHGVSNGTDFATIKKMVPWAVSGKGTGDDNHISGYSYVERERLGLLARRMVDESRVVAVNKLLSGYEAEIFLYAERSTTLENHCLRITRKPAVESR